MASAASAATAEKKTLKSEGEPPAAPEPQLKPPEEPVEFEEPDLGIGYRDLDEAPAESQLDSLEGPAAPLPDLSFVNSLPVKLPPISSDDLAHFDDKVLDALYDRALTWSGDALSPIAGATELVKSLLGERPEAGVVSSSNGSAAAPARAPINIQIPDFATAEESIEVPTLPDAPTDDQLLAFANAHPDVARVRRIFRAKVTGAARITEPAK